jgi:hypothetical protein
MIIMIIEEARSLSLSSFFEKGEENIFIHGR